jgi:hypothetical protein
MRSNPTLLAALCGLCLLVAPCAIAATADEAASYTQKIEERSAKIVKALALDEDPKAGAVQKLLVAQYRSLNAWHETNDAKLKQLRKDSFEKESGKAQAATRELIQLQASLKDLHEAFLKALSAQLSPEKIEAVKDEMTYGKVAFTFKGYLLAYPELSDENKARVLGLLKEARELAMDGGSADEKSEIFNKYKGRINNFLSKQGLKPKKREAGGEKQGTAP